MASWRSYNQVDWSFLGPGFNGTGFLYSDREFDESPAHFTVHGFAGKFGPLHFHQVLWQTKSQFPGIQLRCLYDGQQAEQLDKLGELNLVKWRLIEGRKRTEVEVLAIERPRSNKPRIHHLRELAWLWFKQQAHLRRCVVALKLI